MGRAEIFLPNRNRQIWPKLFPNYFAQLEDDDVTRVW